MKEEFDSLKNDFQFQIDQYNTSIDSKIDGAIAAYLAGIQIVKQEELRSLINDIGIGFVSSDQIDFPLTQKRSPLRKCIPFALTVNLGTGYIILNLGMRLIRL